MPVINSGFPVLSSMAIFYTLVTLQSGALVRGENFDLSTGDFLAFSAAYGIFLGAMQSLGDASVNLMNVVPVYERLEPILQEEPEVDGSKQAPMRLRGGIEISHLFFRYSADSPYVLNDVSLVIEPGEFVALVGGSGSGKSTLMKIMLGFEIPEKGGVYYDGQDLSTLDLRLVRQQLGVVLQESRLLPVDIYRNIVGASARTVADAWEAARKAGLAEDIKRMPMGMHTYVSEGGGGFSGGQKQRLMIARALVHNPKILYLDEATSALDNRTQQIVTESMDRLQSTRIVIAHRLSTIRNADRIFYLENGVMLESGSYDELMALDGAFAQLAKRQLA
jgi:ATP-binding cassette subfamily C protein